MKVAQIERLARARHGVVGKEVDGLGLAGIGDHQTIHGRG
jgi:hypothetical protein